MNQLQYKNNRIVVGRFPSFTSFSINRLISKIVLLDDKIIYSRVDLFYSQSLGHLESLHLLIYN